MTITVIHEVRWLPNDVAERLARLETKLDHVLEILEIDPSKLKSLQENLKSSNDALDSAVKSQQPNS